MKNLTFFLLLIFVFSSTSFSQNKAVRVIGVEEGLSSPSVLGILQDSDGLMWFATIDGLNSYDGKSITVYRNIPSDSSSLSNNQVYDITEDHRGSIWMVTQSGISKLDKITKKFSNYDLRRYMRNPSQLANNSQSTNVVCSKEGTVYVNCMLEGVLQYDVKKDTFIKIEFADPTIKNSDFPVFPLQLFADSDENLFITVIGKGLFKKTPADSLFRLSGLSFSDYNLMRTENISVMRPIGKDSVVVGTQKSVWLLNTATFKIEKLLGYNHPSGNWNLFTGVAVDKNRNLWVSSKGIDGISVIDLKTKSVRKYNRFVLENINGVPLDLGLSLLVDHSGLIWLGTSTKGVMVTDPAREPFQLFVNEPQNPKSLSLNRTFGIYASEKNPDLIYVGTSGGGISILNEKTNEFERFPIKPVNDFFKTGSARAILENPDGKLWVGTWGDGLRLYDLKTKLFRTFNKTEPAGKTLLSDRIRTLLLDSKKRLWIGGDNGLDIYDLQNNSMSHLLSPSNTSLPSNVFQLIRQKMKKPFASISKVGDYADTTLKVEIKKEGYYCLVSVGEANLSSLSNQTRGFQLVDFGSLENKNHQPDSLLKANGNFNFYLSGNNKNRISVLTKKLSAGTYFLHYISDDSHSFQKWNAEKPDEGEWWGVHLLELTKEEAEKINTENSESVRQSILSASFIRVVRGDQNGNIYIGMDNSGFQILNPETMEIQTFSYEKGNENSLSNNNIQDMFIDSKGMVWITTTAGLNRYNPENKTFKKYSTADGFLTNFFVSLIEDKLGNFWVSTAAGISKMSFKPDGSLNIANYDKSDGLQTGSFTALVATRSESGKLYFGGDNGLNSFFPGQVNETPPQMAFSTIHISKTDGMETGLIRRLFNGEKISLSHDQNEISIDFSTLHFTRPEKNKYAHQLLGYDSDWIVDNRNFANYTNLPAGDYTFKIKGANSDGFWSDGNKSFSFEILPPWWETWWAYTSYGIFLIGFVFSVNKFQKHRILEKSKAELILKEAELRAVTAEAQAKIIQAENDRKTLELEEARLLQLSMLPKTIPQFPNLEVAVYMKTATEVGGDYYDFHLSNDGTLTIVIGDATGHGLKAGTLVTATKSLFNTHASNHDILFSLREFSRCISALDFHQLSMCMTIVKINQTELKIGSAGMPPVYVYRNLTRSVEEFVIEGAPLGTFPGFPYQIENFQLQTDDVVLLMTDGFPELINKEGELFNYSRVAELFKSKAHLSPENLIVEFGKSAENWLKGKEADDDITFVILKAKS